MPPTAEDWSAELARYRAYLLLLARMQLDPWPASRIDASDIVQQTLIEAYAKREQFTGSDEARLAWLRCALANNLRDAARALRRGKRDVRREQSLEAAVDESSAQLGRMLAADQSSPSQQAVKNESLLRLADALVELPEGQQEAVVLHHLQGRSLAEVAEVLGRTKPAVAGLLHRGLKRLKELMAE